MVLQGKHQVLSTKQNFYTIIFELRRGIEDEMNKEIRTQHLTEVLADFVQFMAPTKTTKKRL